MIDVEWDNTCRQKTKASTLSVLLESPIVSLRWVEDTPGLEAGHRAALVSVGMLPRARKEDEMFSGCSRWTAAGGNRQHLPSARNLLTLSHLNAFSSLAVNSSLLYFHHLTHIQNLLPGGCCSRKQVQAFDPAPDHWLKGCHFNFRPFSIPRSSSFFQSPGDMLFFKSPSRVLSHRSRLPLYCEPKPTVIHGSPWTERRWTTWGTKWQLPLFLWHSQHLSSMKGMKMVNLKWKTKKACRAIYTHTQKKK